MFLKASWKLFKYTQELNNIINNGESISIRGKKIYIQETLTNKNLIEETIRNIYMPAKNIEYNILKQIHSNNWVHFFFSNACPGYHTYR